MSPSVSALARFVRPCRLLLLPIAFLAGVWLSPGLSSTAPPTADLSSGETVDRALVSIRHLSLPAVPSVAFAPTPTPTPVPTPTPEPTPLPPAPPPPAPPPLPPPGPWERWIDVNLTQQTVTAMLADQPYYTALATTGMPGWETPRGSFRIVSRIYDETMTSTSLGIPEDVESYVMEHVLFTQYFTERGHALHLNYWRSEYYFGLIPSSHGCVGLRYADAEFFWNYATMGTRVEVHY